MLAYIAFWCLFYWGFERFVSGSESRPVGFWDLGGFWETFLRALVFGFTPAIPWFSLQGSLRDLEELEPVFANTAQFEALRSDLRQIETPLRLIGVGVVGALMMLGASTLGAFGPFRGMGGIASDPYVSWSVLWFLMLGWVLARALWLEFKVARRFSQVGEGSIEIDLLDLTPLAPLTRRGLRSVLMWVIWFSLIALFWIGPGAANPGNAFGLMPLLGIAVVALVLPVRGVHRQIRQRKGEELTRLNRAIRAERATLGDFQTRSADPHLANLVSYRNLIDGVREWPFDMGTWVRFSLYLLFGLGSWLGAALVERILETVLK